MRSGVASVGVTRGGNRRTPNKFCHLFKMKNFAIFSLLHTKIKFIPKIFDGLF